MLFLLPFAAADPTINDEWNHISETSAVIYWETSEPTWSYVEYGTVSAAHDNYQNTSSMLKDNMMNEFYPEIGRGYYSHFHMISDLQRNTQYYYRIVSINATSDQEFVSSEKIFSTQDYTSATDIESLDSCNFESSLFLGDMARYEYCIDQPGTYILTRDITVSQGGVWIRASNVVLDLDGHTINYNNIAGENPNGRTGIFMNGNYNSIKILNGKYVQGTGNGQANVDWACPNCGHNPILIFDASTDIEIAGNYLDWYGAQVGGLQVMRGEADIHNNFVNDRGTIILGGGIGYRDRLPSALQTPVGNSNNLVHNNIINRSRHCGIMASGNLGGRVFDNEIYIDSWATNAQAISLQERDIQGVAHLDVEDNLVFGRGYMVEGLYPHNAFNLDVHDNIVRLWSDEPFDRYAEYGPRSNMFGIRMFGELDDVYIYNNTIIIKSKGYGRIRGVLLDQTDAPIDVHFFNNTVKFYSEGLPPTSEENACALVIAGRPATPLFTEAIYNNTIVSDTCHVHFGDFTYDAPRYSLLSNNTFVKEGSNSFYHTFRIGTGAYPSFATFDNIVRDTTLVGEINLRSYLWTAWNSAVPSNYAIEWTQPIDVVDGGARHLDGAIVTITDRYGSTAYSTTTTGQRINPALRETLIGCTVAACQSNIVVTEYSPFTINVNYGGDFQSSNLNLNGRTSPPPEITFVFNSGIPYAENSLCEINTIGNWQPCDSLQFGNTLLRVRTDCRDDDGTIQSARVTLYNADDNKFIINQSQAGSGTPQETIIIDVPNTQIIDSGDFELITFCYDNHNFFGREAFPLSLPWGILSTQQVTGNLNVQDQQTFNYKERVLCSVGECGNIIATLDPQLVLDTPSGAILEDTYSRQGGSTNYDESSYGLVTGFSGSSPYFLWIKVDTSSIPAGSIINSATLQLYHYNDAGSHSGATYNVYGSTTQDWSETQCADHVTRPQQCPVVDQQVGSATPSGGDAGAYWQDFPITNIAWLQQQHDLGITNITFLINRTDNTGSSKYCQFRYREYGTPSSGPRLVVDYSPPGYKGGTIPMNNGNPFYTMDQNPSTFSQFACLQNMLAGNSCEVDWDVVTNTSSGSYNFFVIFEPEIYSSNVNTANSQTTSVSIGSCTPASPYDNNPCDGKIGSSELLAAIGDWFADAITVPELMTNIRLWKSG